MYMHIYISEYHLEVSKNVSTPKSPYFNTKSCFALDDLGHPILGNLRIFADNVYTKI